MSKYELGCWFVIINIAWSVLQRGVSFTWSSRPTILTETSLSELDLSPVRVAVNVYLGNAHRDDGMQVNSKWLLVVRYGRIDGLGVEALYEWWGASSLWGKGQSDVSVAKVRHK